LCVLVVVSYIYFSYFFFLCWGSLALVNIREEISFCCCSSSSSEKEREMQDKYTGDVCVCFAMSESDAWWWCVYFTGLFCALIFMIGLMASTHYDDDDEEEEEENHLNLNSRSSSSCQILHCILLDIFLFVLVLFLFPRFCGNNRIALVLLLLLLLLLLFHSFVTLVGRISLPPLTLLTRSLN
jgi:hypothetical protein